MPGMAIVFGCVVLAITGFGLVLGHGVAAAGSPSSTGPQARTVQLVLSTSHVKIGDNYSATAVGFSPGEQVQVLWTGPTRGTMAAAPPVDANGSTTRGGIVETDPPGNYTLIAVGQTSGRTAFAELQVVPTGN